MSEKTLNLSPSALEVTPAEQAAANLVRIFYLSRGSALLQDKDRWTKLEGYVQDAAEESNSLREFIQALSRQLGCYPPSRSELIGAVGSVPEAAILEELTENTFLVVATVRQMGADAAEARKLKEEADDDA